MTVSSATAATFAPQRVHVRVRGQVQGVGFRPFVYQLAREGKLSGWVRNDAHGVELEVQGAALRVQEFLQRLRDEAPPLARIDAVEALARPLGRDVAFRILASVDGAGRTAVTPDVAACDACLIELFDPASRRYRYPFINCTHCGPRYTITARLPYDRAHTSMARFALCPACAREYHDPHDRRFHAQPNACPVCGPRLTLLDAAGNTPGDDDIIAATLQRFRAGQIVAIKGLGGFHLACDARNAVAVARLRARKQRDFKPFALMVLNQHAVRDHVVCAPVEAALLHRRERSIVLLRKRARCDAVFTGVAPALAELGVMLPYSPLHYLLFHEAAGRPGGINWLSAPHELALVMTSANPGGEPLVRDNAEALQRLHGIADAFVLHDRDIVVRCDDSVQRWRDGAPAFVRRARGYTPQALRLSVDGPDVLALGGWYKNTVCVTRGAEAFVSQHIGDLDNRATCVVLDETVRHLLNILAVRPARIAHDLHPDFYSSRLAARLATELDVPRIAVQHHHAHIAAVCAEHGLRDAVLGVALDGVGLGDDGTAWGGELLRVHGARSERLGHLRTLPLPGGDRAAREPWRMGAAALHLLGRGREIGARWPWREAAALHQAMQRGVNVPHTSSAGRWFDAAAALLHVQDVTRYEGEAAMKLEALALHHGAVAPDVDAYRSIIDPDGQCVLDLLPLLARLADTPDAAFGAALFHATFARALIDWVAAAAHTRQLHDVVLAGGCFLNTLLSASLARELPARGLRVWQARQVPPNDGGLSLGQAWVALHSVAAER